MVIRRERFVPCEAGVGSVDVIKCFVVFIKREGVLFFVLSFVVFLACLASDVDTSMDAAPQEALVERRRDNIVLIGMYGNAAPSDVYCLEVCRLESGDNYNVLRLRDDQRELCCYVYDDNYVPTNKAGLCGQGTGQLLMRVTESFQGAAPKEVRVERRRDNIVLIGMDRKVIPIDLPELPSSACVPVPQWQCTASAEGRNVTKFLGRYDDGGDLFVRMDLRYANLTQAEFMCGVRKGSNLFGIGDHRSKIIDFLLGVIN